MLWLIFLSQGCFIMKLLLFCIRDSMHEIDGYESKFILVIGIVLHTYFMCIFF